MKRLLFLLLLIAASFASEAQAFNNEWIDYNKTYYKFKVRYSNTCRINQSALASVGLQNVNADHFQLWRNGQQVPIYTTSQNAPLVAGGYLEFFGKENDGIPDNPLYRESDYQLNDVHSLETDSATFFLTVNSASPNFRLTPMPNDVAGNVLPPEPYYMNTKVIGYTAQISNGRSELVGDSRTYSSSYDYGEGWTSSDIGAGATLNTSFPDLHSYNGAGVPNPVLRINAAGNAPNPRNFVVKLNGDSIYGHTLDYFDYLKTSFSFDNSKLAGNLASIDIVNKSTATFDIMDVAVVELKYASKFDFSGTNIYNFELPANNSPTYLEITGLITSGTSVILYDLTNGQRYVADNSNPALLKIVLQPSAVDRKLYITNQNGSAITQINSFETRQFIDYSASALQGNYLFITNKLLFGPANGIDPIEDYRNYRSSSSGGNYNVKIYLTDQLTDQFAFGIEQHPLSIRNFIRWARSKYSAPLKNILLIGKAVLYTQYRSYSESIPDMAKQALVPTFGTPASDNLLSAEGNSSIPLTPIGRISIINRQELLNYLNKVKEFEQVQSSSSPIIEDREWMKNIAHVVGGSEFNTSNLLASALNGHKAIIEDSFYAGKVSTFAKTQADAIETVSNEKLAQLFNQGLSILTYFGHSSSSTLEFNLDNPNNYNNQGKYPIFVVMGCNAGNFYNYNPARFSIFETLSEKYVLAPNRGSIAFLASTSLGIIHYLDIYNSRNYQAISRTKYGATIGEVMDEAIKQVFITTTQNDFYARFQCEQFSLHGDPALHYYNFAKPDYAIEESLVRTSPAFLSVSESDFRLIASFKNIGRATNNKIIIEVKRTFPDQTVQLVQRDTVAFSHFEDSLAYIIPINALRDKGLNKFTVTIDPDNLIDELYETNNSVTKEVYVIGDDVKPVFPYNYSIISDQNTKFYASSADPFVTSRQFNLEVDTTENFNSGTKVSKNLTSTGGVFDFSPGVTFQDSTVYYWRVSAVNPGGPTIWNNSSFQFIANSHPGFSQAHYFQHLKSQYKDISLDSTQRMLSYDSATHTLYSTNGIYPTAGQEGHDFLVANDGDDAIQSACLGNSLIFNIFDPYTFKPVANPDGRYFSAGVCDYSRSWNFEFSYLDVVSRKHMMDFMDSIPDHFVVVVRNIAASTTNGFVNEWQADTALYGHNISLYHKLVGVGFSPSVLDSFNQKKAFIFMYQKNYDGFEPVSAISDGVFDLIKVNKVVQLKGTHGTITSPAFGPAKKWDQLVWRGTTTDPFPTDETSLDIIGVNQTGAEVTLITGITTPTYDISSINPVQYPGLKIRINSADTVYVTPSQLKYWMLTYDPVPEGAIAPNIYFTSKDTVEVGEPFNFGIAFKNISNVNFDSVKVKLSITDKNNVENIIPVPRQKNLLVGDTIKLNIPIQTTSLSGHNSVFVNFNPNNDQPEHLLYNNYAFRGLYVRPDSLNPFLDVTFDGVHILNKDIVATKPIILVNLTDNAKWLLLDDTSLISVSVKYPDGTTHPYYFSSNSDTLQFTPASRSVDNKASINFKPYFPIDGEYELIVYGKDKSGNTTGAVKYRVAFQVISKPMISNMLNYPNPFTTSTAFVFTVTGSQVPQNIRIQILTITGKIVRDITKDELGPLHVGRNITEFKWDGTDQYGQKLANGIYLYRVITNLNGKSLDKYKAKDDNTDQYFNKGYGKMYLMR